jgi:endonuclease-3
MPKRAVPRSVPTPARSKAETRQILQKLYGQHPGADTELHFSNAYELLVATILSAQCTDERVNQVTPALFRRYPDARALAKATTTELEPQIQSTGFFRAKSRSLVGMATAVVEHHDGEIPRTMEDLVALPGVGRKTANVVLGHALGVPGLPVDRHVLRVANRIGIARSEDPVIVEQQLCSAVPPADWTRTSDTLILHGRRICKPRPLCDRCAVRQECEYYRTVVGLGLGTKKAVGLKPAGVRLKPDTTTARRGAKRRVARPIGEIRSDRSDSRQPSKMGKASSLRDAQEAPPDRPESGPSSKVRRAAKPRGTGRGGGAPRQTKK